MDTFHKCLFSFLAGGITGIAIHASIVSRESHENTCENYTRWKDEICINTNNLTGEGHLVGCQVRTCLDTGAKEIREIKEISE